MIHKIKHEIILQKKKKKKINLIKNVILNNTLKKSEITFYEITDKKCNKLAIRDR